MIAGHGRILAADAARADRGAGDRARPPDRGAAAGLPARGQPAGRARRLGRGAARRRAAGAGRRRTSTCRSSASPTPSSTSCSPSMSAAARRPRGPARRRSSCPEPPRNPASRTGDLWILGDHRLLCGDSTSAADVRRLMNGERAMLFATDPPYLVDYDGSNHPTRNKDWSPSYGVDLGRQLARAPSSTTASSPRPSPRRSPRTPPGTAGTPRAARRCWRPAGRRPAPSCTSRSSG